MKSRFGAVLAGCLLAMVFGSSVAQAADGRIQFSGAIVAPTCAASEVHIEALIAAQVGADAGSSKVACFGADAGIKPTSYSLTVTTLDPAVADNDRLLAYFVGYVNAADNARAQVKLVTQTFV